MVNAADLNSLNQAQQYERIREAIRTRELTQSEGVAMAIELRLPENMRRSLSTSNVAVVGYGEAGKGGAADNKPLPSNSPLFVATPSMTLPEANQLDLTEAPMQPSTQPDRITAPAGAIPASVTQKMRSHARALLDQVNLAPNQPLRVSAHRDFLPFIALLAEEAYQRSSGLVSVRLLEPRIEELQAKYSGHAGTLSCKDEEDSYWRAQGAAWLQLTDLAQSPYVAAGLTWNEIQGLVASISPPIPEDVLANLFRLVDPVEILETKLHVQKGEGLYILAHREQEPEVLRLLEYIYAHGLGPVDVEFVEAKAYNLSHCLARYGSVAVKGEVPGNLANRYQEFIAKNVTRITLHAVDPTRDKDLTPAEKRDLDRYASLSAKAVAQPLAEVLLNNKRLVLNVPTRAAALSAYGHETIDPDEALRRFAADSIKLNRVGTFDAHMDVLERVATRMNDLLARGYQTIHFVSKDPVTGEPDGKTDLYVELTPKSKFILTRKLSPRGEVFTANTPSEEVFSTPDRRKTRGCVSLTRPMLIGSTAICGVKIWFKDGQIERTDDGGLHIEADNPQDRDTLVRHVQNNENSDRLGEVSLVAGSPIFAMNRVFNSTLIDENATCHLALGNGYPQCIRMEDKGDRSVTDFLDDVHCNRSPVHNDFMIGGPHVEVSAINDTTKDEIVLIAEDQFRI